MRIKAHTIERYVQRQAEGTARSVLSCEPSLLPIRYSSASVVPIFDEEPHCLDRLVAAIAEPELTQRRLIIAVFNTPLLAKPEQAARTLALMNGLSERGSVSLPFGTTSLRLVREPFRSDTGVPRLIDVLAVDATGGEFGLRKKEGVGRARKLGVDLALALFMRGALVASMLGSTDADAQLPPRYFSELEAEQHASALLFPYTHKKSGDCELDLGMTQLEATFRYYVLGLSYAGSPYAYHSLGSAMAVSLPHYAAARGFPNRQAGEDFYLLSKLAQLHDLRRVRTQEIQITTRLSGRVPFGTGPRLAQWLAERQTTQAPILAYDPRVFVTLRTFLDRMKRAASLGEAAPESSSDLVDGEVQAAFGRLQPALIACPSAEHRVRRVHEQFDALATLQFIHRFSREQFPEIGLDVALSRIGVLDDGMRAGNTQPSWDLTLAQLRRLEGDLPEWVGPRAALTEVLDSRLSWAVNRPGPRPSDAG